MKNWRRPTPNLTGAIILDWYINAIYNMSKKDQFSTPPLLGYAENVK